MKIAILDDYFDTLRTLPCFAKLAGHDVTVWNDHVQDTDALAERLRDTEVLVLIRERTKIRAPLLERLPKLRLISQRSVYPHIDIDACTRLRRHRVVEPASRHAVLCRGRADLGAGPRGDAADPAADGGAARPATGRSASAARCAARRSASSAMAASARRRRLRPRLRHERAGVGARAVAGAGARRRLRRRRRARRRSSSDCDVLSLHMRLVAADARHRHRRRSRAHEADRAAGQHQPRAADRAGRAGGGAARRPARAWRRSTSSRRSRCATRDHPLLAMDNVVCTPHIGYVTRDEYEMQFTDIFDQIVGLRGGHADQRGQSRRAGGGSPARSVIDRCRCPRSPGARDRDVLTSRQPTSSKGERHVAAASEPSHRL